MARKVKLHTTIALQDELALALGAIRRGTTTVRVSVTALNAILRDHSTFCDHVGVENLEVPK